MVADRQNSAQQLGAEPEIQVTQGVRKPVVARGVQNFDQQWGQCGEFIESGKILTLDQCTKFFEISIVDVRVITPRRACLHSSPRLPFQQGLCFFAQSDESGCQFAQYPIHGSSLLERVLRRAVTVHNSKGYLDPTTHGIVRELPRTERCPVIPSWARSRPQDHGCGSIAVSTVAHPRLNRS